MLKAGAEWLVGQRRAHASLTVTYSRGENSVELSAAIGNTPFELDDGHGVITRIESRDFLITAWDLVLDGSETVPQAGDKIRETVGSQGIVYEAMAPGDEPPYRYSDSHRHSLRIHTKQVDTEAV